MLRREHTVLCHFFGESPPACVSKWLLMKVRVFRKQSKMFRRRLMFLNTYCNTKRYAISTQGGSLWVNLFIHILYMVYRMIIYAPLWFPMKINTSYSIWPNHILYIISIWWSIFQSRWLHLLLFPCFFEPHLDIYLSVFSIRVGLQHILQLEPSIHPFSILKYFLNIYFNMSL